MVKERDIIKELNLKPDKVIDLIQNMKPVLKKLNNSDYSYYNNLASEYTIQLSPTKLSQEMKDLTFHNDDNLIREVALNFYDNQINEIVVESTKRSMLLYELFQQYVPKKNLWEEELLIKDLDKIIDGISKEYNLNLSEKGETMEYISKEDMIINKLHLNPIGVLKLSESMKEIVDTSGDMYFNYILENQISTLHGKEIDKELESLKINHDDIGCTTPDLTMQILNYQKETRGNAIIPKDHEEWQYMLKGTIMEELFQQYVPERDVTEEYITSEDLDKVIKGIAKDFKLENFQKTENTEKQGLSYEIEQTFKANINGVPVTRAEVFDASLDILSTIQRTKNIPMNDKEFTEHLVESMQRMSDKNEYFDYSEMLEGTYASLTSAPTLKDFKIVDYYGQNPKNSYASNLNAKMENGDFEHLKPKTTTKLNTLSKEKSMSR